MAESRLKVVTEKALAVFVLNWVETEYRSAVSHLVLWFRRIKSTIWEPPCFR